MVKGVLEDIAEFQASLNASATASRLGFEPKSAAGPQCDTAASQEVLSMNEHVMSEHVLRMNEQVSRMKEQVSRMNEQVSRMMAEQRSGGG